MRVGKYIDVESRCHRCVLDRLHLDCVGRSIPLKLGNDQPSLLVKPEDVESVLFGTCLRLPSVELGRHHQHTGAKDPRVRKNPLLQVFSLSQPCVGECDPSGGLRGLACHGEHELVGHRRTVPDGLKRGRRALCWLNLQTEHSLAGVGIDGADSAFSTTATSPASATAPFNTGVDTIPSRGVV
jgi:hypothetical protein